MRKMDIMISFDVIRIYLINILWKKIRQIFLQKKVVRNFRKGTPFGICMKSNVT